MRGLVARAARSDRARALVNRCMLRVAGRGWLGRTLASRALRQVPAVPFRAVFVCKGNICRSAFAEAAARGLVPAAAGWSFASAGLEATEGNPPPEAAVRVAREFGIDLSTHRARRVGDIAPGAVDVVFVMEPAQAAHPRLAPFRRSGVPIVLLGWAAGRPVVEDPYGRSDDAFRACFSLLAAALDRVLAARG